MPTFRRVFANLRALLRGRQREQELTDELTSFLDASIESKIQQGLPPAQAARAARAELGGVEAVKERVRDVGWDAALLSVWHDLSYAVRTFMNRPVFSGVAIASIALGVGSAAVIVSWAESLLLRPLGPARQQRELRVLHVTSSSRNDLSLSYPSFQDIRTGRSSAMLDVGAFTMVGMTMRIDGGAERVWGQLVSGNLFDLLRVGAVRGRTLVAADETVPSGHTIAVLSHEFWLRRFGGRNDILNVPITLNGRVFTIIGVAEPGFKGAQPIVGADVFVSLSHEPVFFSDQRLADRGHGWLNTLVRVAPDASDAAVRAELDVIGARLAADHPASHGERGLRAYPIWQAPSGGSQLFLPILSMLAGIVGLLLLLTTANVAGLMLTHLAGRRRELAIRTAMGASRWRVVRQVLTEVLLLTTLGGVAGASVANWSGSLLMAFLPSVSVPIRVDAGVSALVLLIASAVTMFTGLWVAIVPALHTRWATLASALHGGHPLSARPIGRARRVLVVAQLALALVLLVSAGLFVRTMQQARHLDPGFAARQGLIAAVDLLPAGYDAGNVAQFMARVTRSITSVPGVEDVSVARRAPLTTTGSSDRRVDIDGYVPSRGEEMSIHYNQIGPRFFATLQLPITQGREFDERDTAQSAPVVIVSETMARRYWPGRPAIGGRIRLDDRWAEVVGIARDAKDSGLTDAARPFMYLPLTQSFRPDVRLIVRTSVDPGAVVEPLRARMAQVDPNTPLFDVTTLREHVAFSLSLFELVASLLTGFGLTALGLAALGLYGVMALTVGQRTNEIGLRVSLGATPGDIGRLIANDALRLLGLGGVIGLAVAMAVTRLFEGQLVGVSSLDPASYGGTSLVLLLAAACASAVPLWRAMRVEPITALRAD